MVDLSTGSEGLQEFSDLHSRSRFHLFTVLDIYQRKVHCPILIYRTLQNTEHRRNISTEMFRFHSNSSVLSTKLI